MQFGGGPGGPAQNSSQPLMILLLGIAGIVLCQLCSPIAWVIGNSYMKECTATGRQPDQMAVIGRILGMVGTALFILTILFLILYFIVIAGAIATNL